MSLAYIHKCFCTAIANNKMVVIKVANALLHSAQQGYEKTSVHMEELRKVRVSIGSKRRKAKAQLVKEVKGAKLKNFKKLVSGIFLVIV